MATTLVVRKRVYADNAYAKSGGLGAVRLRPGAKQGEEPGNAPQQRPVGPLVTPATKGRASPPPARHGRLMDSPSSMEKAAERAGERPVGKPSPSSGAPHVALAEAFAASADSSWGVLTSLTSPLVKLTRKALQSFLDDMTTPEMRALYTGEGARHHASSGVSGHAAVARAVPAVARPVPAAVHVAAAAAGADGWGGPWPGELDASRSRVSAHATSPASKELDNRLSRARELEGLVVGLRRELAESRAECAGLRAAADELQRDLQLTTAKCIELGAKNRSMQERVTATDSGAGAAGGAGADAGEGTAGSSGSGVAVAAAAEEHEFELAEQMRRQMERLVAEKARLAQDNARLARENTSLHELLSYQMCLIAQDEEEDMEVDDEQEQQAEAQPQEAQACCSAEAAGDASEGPTTPPVSDVCGAAAVTPEKEEEDSAEEVDAAASRRELKFEDESVRA